MKPLIEGILYSREQAQVAERAKASAIHLGRTLWYFDMYGPAGQSFHDRYQRLGTRGLPPGHTIVV